ncbi:hypothetical protein [Massilia sp. SYSU DXS3249]
MKNLFAKKNRGEFKDEPLYPHLHADGTYVATNSKFKADYIRVDSLSELAALVSAGYGARMSNPATGQAPSYISHKNITIAGQEKLGISLKQFLSSFVEGNELDRTTMARYRKEQTFLRTYLLKGKQNGQCTLCGWDLPAELLIAAHIKPRSTCSHAEKLDFDNVATLMCALGCDSLFEEGFILVQDGVINKNSKRKNTLALSASIDRIAGRTVPNWPASSVYYQAHAKAFS